MGPNVVKNSACAASINMTLNDIATSPEKLACHGRRTATLVKMCVAAATQHMNYRFTVLTKIRIKVPMQPQQLDMKRTYVTDHHD